MKIYYYYYYIWICEWKEKNNYCSGCIALWERIEFFYKQAERGSLRERDRDSTVSSLCIHIKWKMKIMLYMLLSIKLKKQNKLLYVW